MTSRMELRHPYPVPGPRLVALFTDPEFLRAKLDAVGGPGARLLAVRAGEATAGTANGAVTVELRQAVPAAALPSVARSLVPGDLAIERTERWTPRGGTVHATVAGAPGEITGQWLLDPAPDGCVLAGRLAVTIGVPLVGGRLERAVLDGLAQLLDTEHRFTLRWLQQSAPGRPSP